MSPPFGKKMAGRRVNSSGSPKPEASTSPSTPVCATVPLSLSSHRLRARRQKPQTDSLFGVVRLSDLNEAALRHMDRNERQLPVLCPIYHAPDARQNFLKSLQVVCSLREQI